MKRSDTLDVGISPRSGKLDAGLAPAEAEDTERRKERKKKKREKKERKEKKSKRRKNSEVDPEALVADVKQLNTKTEGAI